MVQLLHDSLAAGGLGLSTSRSSTHNDGDGNPVPSRAASEEELLTLCAVVGEHQGTTLEAIVEGCLRGFYGRRDRAVGGHERPGQPPAQLERPSVRRPPTPTGDRAASWPSAAGPGDRGRVVALTMPIFADNNMSLGTFCALWLIPGWHDVLALPLAEKTRASCVTRPVREEMERPAKGTVFERLADFSNYRIGDTVAPQNKTYEGRLITDIARERGMDPADALVDITAADEFKTVLWPLPTNDTDEDWAVRGATCGVGRTCCSADPTPGPTSTGCWARPTRPGSWPTPSAAAAWSPSRRRPADDRRPGPRSSACGAAGVSVEGAFADMVVFDPDTVDSGPARRVFDLPATAFG